MVVEGDGAESCCLLSEERCEGNQKKARYGGGGWVPFWCPALSCPALQGPGGCQRRGGCCVDGGCLERGSFTLSFLVPPVCSLSPLAPPCRSVMHSERRCVWTECWYARRPWGVLERDARRKACVEGGVPSVLPPGHTASFLAVCPSATWLILPVVICSAQRLSHACLSIRALARNCERLITTVVICTALSSSLVG